MESSPSEDAVKTVETTTEDLEDCTNEPSWENSSGVWANSRLWKKFYRGYNGIKQHHLLPRDPSWREKSFAANFIVLFEEIAMATPTFSKHHPDQSAAINIEWGPSTSKEMMTHWKLRWWLVSTFWQESTFWSKPYAQRGAWTHDPTVKSCIQ